MEKTCLDQSVTSEAVRAELGRILASAEFKTSKRCRDFLEFIVVRTLAGSSEELKERTIGIEVFGRSPTYNTGTDGIVRINASEVRKRLAIYYADPNRHSECHISLPAGSYVPIFSPPSNPSARVITELSLSTLPRPSSSRPTAANGSSPAPASIPDLSPKYQRRAWLLLLLILAAVSTMVMVFVRRPETHTAQTIVDTFWQPMLQGKTPIMIVPAYVPAYDAEAEPPDGRFTLLTDQYVGGGDLIAAVQISSMLARLRHSFQVRLGTEVSLDDLRNTPTVLIGYSSAQWSGITKKFRFYVDDASNGIILDNGKPTAWYPRNETRTLHAEEDYAVISRAFDPETHAPLILVSGCLQYGTQGAARLITNPELLAAAMSHAPHGWQKKNLQLVVQFDVVDNTPASSHVVASYYW